jgi:hypothetical protein
MIWRLIVMALESHKAGWRISEAELEAFLAARHHRPAATKAAEK